ncbi:MAG: sulfite exporter TauE/SafE family protein [Bacilli bacterium]|nr:sulfite exporter TauE/SafE family protein [Bacilli bacterium]
MNKIFVKIDGMTCDNCRLKIKERLYKIKNIKELNFDGLILEIEYTGKLSKDKIIDNIINLGYFTNEEMISNKKSKLKRNIDIKDLVIISLVFIILIFILNKIFNFNIFNVIPVIDEKTTLLMLFVTGLLTSIHCISMCGAINLLASTSSNRSLKKPLLYNLGRLTSYTILGGIVGLIGSAFKINVYVQGIIIIIASIFMFLMSLSMMGIINFSLNIKLPKFINKVKRNNSFVIGLFNGFMPCGPLQAMQLYALSTGSFIYGALSMFIFCLGTIPLMLFIGVISNYLNNNNRKLMSKISTVLILILSIVMFNRGLVVIGVDVTNIFKPNYDNYLRSEIIDNYQEVEVDISYKGYEDFIVQKGIPVKLIVNVFTNSLTGCNNEIVIKGFDISKKLEVGKNIIRFTPNKKGVYTYGCWMGMLKNKIIVVDDISLFERE